MSSEKITIQAEHRAQAPRGFHKKSRLQGLIPGILYRQGKSFPISVHANTLPKKHSHSQVISMSIDGKEHSVLMREVQVNPLNDSPLHFDFQEVSSTDKVRVHVPLNFIGLTREQEKEGQFSIRVRYLELRTTVSQLPQQIDVDVSTLKAGESIQLFDLNLSKDFYVKTGKGKNVALASIVKL